ncbi:hypothetical protein KP509_26G049800 [Ceratopteris richardii]|uniref:Uncharacterized protein n=1 Tax=Ceratopteris richardii TaxID=49495 RepID=A0A8T2RN69_CERRI|nr:hypothetical protein KP509_26G049800 [Ceratopteris richardii]
MVTDEEIMMRIVGILQNADLTTTTTAAIRRQLEEDLGIDLTDKKAFIREQVDLYLHTQQQQQQQHQHHLYLQTQQQYFHSFQQQQQHHHHPHQQTYLPPHYYTPNFTAPHIVEDEPDVHEDNSLQFEPEIKRTSQGKPERKKKDAQQKEKKKRTGGGLNKTCGVSPELRAIIGDKELTRTQVVKELWIYIREKNLQDPENRRKIVCNDELRSLLGCDSTDMFKMNKLLARHIFTLQNPTADGEEPKPKKPRPEKREGSENDEGKRVGGFTALQPISEALINFLGTGESELSRSEVTKRIWEYIKGNQLQDPTDKRRIICDGKLQELFGCDSFHGFGMAKYLSPHFIKG